MLNMFLNARAKVGKEDECWLWKGPVDKKTGYGRSSWLEPEVGTAHRVTYILAYGDYLKVIDGRKTCIRHLCNNRLCVNPKHLALGTYSDNNIDASMAGRGTKMTLDKLKTAVKLRNEGLTYRAIGKVIGLGEAVVAWSIRGKSHYCRGMLKAL